MACFGVAKPEESPSSAPSPSMSCSTIIYDMADCISFISEGSKDKKPTPSCCTGFKTVVQADADCICEALKSTAELGIDVNLTRAATLSSACRVSAPPLSKCDVSTSPEKSPSPSPEKAPSPSHGAAPPSPAPKIAPSPPTTPPPAPTTAPSPGTAPVTPPPTAPAKPPPSSPPSKGGAPSPNSQEQEAPPPVVPSPSNSSPPSPGGEEVPKPSLPPAESSGTFSPLPCFFALIISMLVVSF
ncbi:hypothetical protein COLO4_16459 [Corchorus olitorius]|uniref:Bifunctional inhibitor/plant lipid transfer protein/seed storage helical domain-containing protein n=1 Tax=Corchorus olitorius TaxID=93759 RepID=A0A1R3JHB0_9ROSI|nr:hypothetical protein COLO4_16459 [Corchorus olitorius]